MLKLIPFKPISKGKFAMKHELILEQLLTNAKNNPNVVGFLVFGSVASGTHNEESDIDTLTVLWNSKSTSGIHNSMVEGVKVGNIFFTLEVLRTGTKTVPYLLYPVANAKILFDRENMITPLLEQINKYFNENTEVKAKWIAYYKQFKKEKAQFGYEKTTIIDVWNELEKEYSGGKIRRPFFNSFPFRNRLVFSILKRFL
jgi:hypothetical protein